MIMYVKKKQRQLIDYFIQGRHKNCSVIYLSQSFYKTPKDIGLNCSHYCVYEFPSSRERNMILAELGVSKEKFKKATQEPFSFLYVDKPKKKIKKNFYGKYIKGNLRFPLFSPPLATPISCIINKIKWVYLTNNLQINIIKSH